MFRIGDGKMAIAAVFCPLAATELRAADAFPSDRTAWATPIVTISVTDAEQELDATDIASMKAADFC